MNRFDNECPQCEIGSNSKHYGGSEKCFHCDNCNFVECQEDLEDVIEMLTKRLKNFYKEKDNKDEKMGNR